MLARATYRAAYRGLFGACVFAWAAQSVAVRGETLDEVLPTLLTVSNKIQAAEADVGAAREKAKEALGEWYPRLDITSSYGYERQFKGNNTTDTSMPPRAFDAKITQLLWDFGSANKTIDNARLAFEQAVATRAATENTVLLEGVTAYLDLMRREKLAGFSRDSEGNIKRQTELEDSRVRLGQGYTTDVLQAKRQLAGAQASRVRAEGALQIARNRYLNVFETLPARLDTMAIPPLPLELLPKQLNDVVDIAGRENPQLKAAKLQAEIARNNVSKTLSDKFAPNINIVGESNHKDDYDGTLGQKNNRLVKLEAKYSFNLGLTAINTLKMSEYNLTSTEKKYKEALNNVQEQARNAWQEFQTAQANAEHLRNEAHIATEFLELARKERALGRRSLIDVLAGETALINASSDAASAETDVAIAIFKLLGSMGRLGFDVLATGQRGQVEGSSAATAAEPAPPPAVPVAAVAAEPISSKEKPRAEGERPQESGATAAVDSTAAGPSAASDAVFLYIRGTTGMHFAASFSSPAVRTLEKCQKVRHVQDSGKWTLVRLENNFGVTEGWVYVEFLSKDEAGCKG